MDSDDDFVPSQHPLLAPLAEEQQALLSIVSDVWLANSRWPIRQYVEHEMDRKGYDFLEVASALPAIRGSGAGPLVPVYQVLWFDGLSGAPDRPVGITMAGFAHLPEENQPTLQYFLRLLSGMASHFLESSFNAFEVEQPEVSLLTLARHLRLSSTGLVDRMPDFFEHEPATWGGQTSGTEGGEPQWRYTRAMRNFVGLSDVNDYLYRLDAYLSPAREEVSPPVEPPLGLAAALDFLDTAWRLRYGRRLLSLPSAQVVTTLADDAVTPEEFDARLSALGQVLKSFDVERAAGVPNHPIQHLKAKLLQDLPPEAHPRIDRAVSVLEATVFVRNAGQHANAAARTITALRDLGLSYPIVDWEFAWSVIRSRAAGALADIREELLADLAG